MTSFQRFLRVMTALFVGAAASACTLTDTNTSAVAVAVGSPVVRLASPLPSDTYAAGAAVTILGRVENASADITMVDILLDNQSIGSQPDPNESGSIAFTVTNSWLAAQAGDHVITLRVLQADGTAAESSVTISVVDNQSVQALVSPTTSSLNLPTPVVPAQTLPTTAPNVSQTLPTSAPTQNSAPSASNTPPPAPTSSAPSISVISGANIRSGPSVNFNPAVGSLAAGATGDIIAISPDRQWYRIRYNNGSGSGWISATTVTTSGDLSGLPIDPGPATPSPTAIPATAVPATTVPATTVATANTDLSVTLLATNPDPLVCNQAATITVTVVNTGSTASAATTLLLQDLYNSTPGSSASVPVKALGQNESVDLTLTLNVSTNFSEAHTLRARVDPDNIVPENNEANNDNNKAYTLAQGGC